MSVQYPFLARIHHLAGLVNVRVEVGPDGKVVNAKASGPAPILVEAAERNVALWQFDVPKKGPYPVVGIIVYDFKLTGKPSAQGLTTIEFMAPNHVIVVDQPSSERVPEPQPPGEDLPIGHGPGLLERLRDRYESCHGVRPSPDISLGQLIDDDERCRKALETK